VRAIKTLGSPGGCKEGGSHQNIGFLNSSERTVEQLGGFRTARHDATDLSDSFTRDRRRERATGDQEGGVGEEGIRLSRFSASRRLGLL